MNTYCKVDANSVCMSVCHTNDDEFLPFGDDSIITSGADRSWVGTKYYNGNAWNDYTEPVRAIPKGEVIDRFTTAELEAILTLAKTNTKAQVFVNFVMAQDVINLDGTKFVGALTAMTTAGILAAGRAEEIRA